MRVTFFGVRGSIPTPGRDFVRYGGNTACVHVELNDNTDIVLDAGSGIRQLGKQLIHKDSPVHLLLSHNHWDHIQGFPFFAPIFQEDRKIFITPGQTTLAEDDQILRQMHGSVFPVPPSALLSDIEFFTPHSESDGWHIGEAHVCRLPLNHPGKGSAYAIATKNTKLVYMTDNELYPPYKKETDFLSFVEFAKDADLIIHDAQYMISDMPKKSGWGHSVAEEAVKLAMACKAKRLALYSHDPERTDDDIDNVVKHCHDYIETVNTSLVVQAASEGLTITL